MKTFILAAAAAGAIALGTLSFSTPSQAAAGTNIDKSAVPSNVVDARCWRDRWGRLRCGPRWHGRRCFWHRGHRVCRW
jgi:hypothetical protein